MGTTHTHRHTYTRGYKPVGAARATRKTERINNNTIHKTPIVGFLDIMSQETNNILSFDRTNEFLSSKNHEWELTLNQYNFLITQFKREDTNNDLHIDFNELS